MCVSRPLAHHLSCAHFTASLKYHRYMKHIPLIHNYICYLYRKTLRIKKVENWFYNIDSSSGFFFLSILPQGAIFWLTITHAGDGYLPKTHLSGAILHTAVDTGLALMCGQDVEYMGGTFMSSVSPATPWQTPLNCLSAVNLTLMAFSVCGQLLQVRVITEPQLLWNLLPCYWTHGWGTARTVMPAGYSSVPLWVWHWELKTGPHTL